MDPFADNADDLPTGFQRKYNRDYHAIIKNDKLAAIYEFYIKRDFEQAFLACDVVATPTSPTTAFRLGEKTDDPLQMYLADVFTVPGNMRQLQSRHA